MIFIHTVNGFPGTGSRSSWAASTTARLPPQPWILAKSRRFSPATGGCRDRLWMCNDSSSIKHPSRKQVVMIQQLIEIGGNSRGLRSNKSWTGLVAKRAFDHGCAQNGRYRREREPTVGSATTINPSLTASARRRDAIEAFLSAILKRARTEELVMGFWVTWRRHACM